MGAEPPPIPENLPPVPPQPNAPPVLDPAAPVAGEARHAPGIWFLKPIRLAHCSNGWQFIVRILIQQFAVKLAVSVPVGILMFWFGGEGKNAQTELLREPLLAFALMVLVAPPLETLLFQAAPIELLRKLRRSRRLQFLFGALPFAAVHFLDGVEVGIGAGIVGGLFFSHTYLEGRTRSLWSALWITTVTHALHNLVVFPLALVMAA